MMKEIIKGYVSYVKENKKYDEDICFWVMGHGMGGGVANIIGYNLINDKEINGRDDNVYCYTFAAPNTFYEYDAYEEDGEEKYITSKINPKSNKYRCIFNIVNEDDFVPKLPIIRKFFYIVMEKIYVV